MSEPREWWICDRWNPVLTERITLNEKPQWLDKDIDVFHVIEYSAYESLKESLTLAKKQRDEWECRYLALLKKITDEIPLL